MNFRVRHTAIAWGIGLHAALLANAVWAKSASGESPSPPRVERIELTDGRRLEGLIESENDVWVNLIEIRRPPGRPMFLIIRPIDRRGIAKIDYLAAADKSRLQAEIDRFRNRAQIEAAQIEAVQLSPSASQGAKGWTYQGAWFRLDSTTDETTIRRIVVRLEQVFTAYRQIMPPRCNPSRPLRIVVFDSLEEYRAQMAQRSLRIENRACFFPAENLLAAASELAAFGAELKAIDQSHARIRRELETLKARLPERLRELKEQLQTTGQPRNVIDKLLSLEKLRAQKEIDDKGKELRNAERKNSQVVERAAGQMFSRLYHEAFHAYLENYVYPHAQYDVPYWLNEGLAVMMESGVLDDGRLRVDGPNRDALKELKKDLAGKEQLPLEKLLAADQRAFLVHSGAPSAESQRYYAAAWGLAYYLTNEKGVLRETRLNEYVSRSAVPEAPLSRFEKLVAAPAAEFEKEWRAAILAMRP